MTTNAIAISRNLAVAGLEKSIADAVAEAVVSHAEASHATKADFVKLEAAVAHSEETYATKADLAELKSELKADIAEVRSEIAEVKSEIRALAVQVKISNGFDGWRIATPNKPDVLSRVQNPPMTTNAIAISRNLAVAGLEKSVADAVAEAVVSHSEESHATKADFVKLEATVAHFEETYVTKADFAELRGEFRSEIRALAVQVKILIVLVVGVVLLLISQMV